MASDHIVQTTQEGTVHHGYVTRSAGQWPYLVPARFVARRRLRDGVLTWRTEVTAFSLREARGVPGSWIRCGTKKAREALAEDNVFCHVHGSVCD